jgi:hypothetical protein
VEPHLEPQPGTPWPTLKLFPRPSRAGEGRRNQGSKGI